MSMPDSRFKVWMRFYYRRKSDICTLERESYGALAGFHVHVGICNCCLLMSSFCPLCISSVSVLICDACLCDRLSDSSSLSRCLCSCAMWIHWELGLAVIALMNWRRSICICPVRVLSVCLRRIILHCFIVSYANCCRQLSSGSLFQWWYCFIHTQSSCYGY